MGHPQSSSTGRLLTGFGALVFVALGAGGCDGALDKLTFEFVYRPVDRLVDGILLAMPFWVALGVTLSLERLFPAQPRRTALNVSLAHDVVWFLYEPLLQGLILGTYVAMLQKIWERHLSTFAYSGLAAAPWGVRVAAAILLLDLCYWMQHVLNHKVPLLWRFHAIHHSQRELNFFTDFRYHVLEYVVRQTFLVVPFLVLRIDAPVIVVVAILREWYSRFYHGNIRTSLGPLRYVLVTPQSHRIHHSLDPRHRDMNFGAIFSVWDFLFRRQYKGFDEYPETGIDDGRFPHERAMTVRSLLLTPWLQMLYPFQRAHGR
jgi:sterol desaturase/sphingolipid hydroxylase (fatty acid hydroxylase superfamily)